jgi:ADP-heptose:LPS heptosyltransferase
MIGTGTTGSVAVAQYHIATAVKVTSISWVVTMSQVLNSSNFKTTFYSALQIRKKIYNKVDRIIYLPFSNENWLIVLKKYILSFILAPITINRNGFKYFKKFPLITSSQYFSYFPKLGIEFILNENSINSFLKTESIVTGKKFKKKSKRIAIYPNSKLNMKIWPIENFIKVIDSIAKIYNIDFYLIGSSEDYEYNQTLINNLSKDIKIQNLAGKLDIANTINFLSSVDLLLSNDGAPVHMGSLVNTPIVGLYTYKEPIGSWDPILSKKYVVIKTDVLCKNCFKDICINPICIKYIPASTVLKACQDLLEGKITGRENKVLIPQNAISYKSINY